MEAVQDDFLVLIDRTPVGPWYHIVHVESGKEGWVNGNAIEIRYTREKKLAPPLEERSTGSNRLPSIEITNDSDSILYLNIGDTRYTIGPHSGTTIELAPGSYKYYGSSPGILPIFGENYLKAGYVYTWRFYVVTVPGD